MVMDWLLSVIYHFTNTFLIASLSWLSNQFYHNFEILSSVNT